MGDAKDVTVADAASANTLPAVSQATTEPISRHSAIQIGAELGERYEIGVVIGRGGMGEVRLARDSRIDREVAVKLMRHSEHNEADVARFFREARVQGVLEHPAVVPVHDMGIDAKGRPYFVMKRLAGITLADVLASPDPAVHARWPRRTLLQRLTDICLAVELAHERGVIHRDLKPANIMLGDYGEAYVLDWGLAKISDEHESVEGVMPLSGDESFTQVGAMLGTPGYCSPEQARGEGVATPTDVFALGMTLYEVLARKPALGRGLAAIAETLAADEHRPSKVALDIPLELDDLCARATATDPGARPTARALAQDIQRYLDGDRDHAQRTALAATHASAAVAAASTGARALAMREAGAAIALDHTNREAAAVLGQMLVAAPTQIPPEALARADEERAVHRRSVFEMAQWGFVGLIVLACSLFLLSPRAVWPVALTVSLGVGMFSVARYLSRRVVPGKSRWFLTLVILAALMLFMAGVMFGPVLVAPVFLIGAIAGFLSQPSDFNPFVPILVLAAPIFGVFALEQYGVLPSTMSFVDGGLLIKPHFFHLSPTSTYILLALTIATQIMNTAVLFIRAGTVARNQQDQMHAQQWHLEQILPTGKD